MEPGNIVAVLAILVLALVTVVVLLRVMRARHRAGVQVIPAPQQPPPTRSQEEEEYLDSSHISGPILPGRDPRK
jgi:hypothetical protein